MSSSTVKLCVCVNPPHGVRLIVRARHLDAFERKERVGEWLENRISNNTRCDHAQERGGGGGDVFFFSLIILSSERYICVLMRRADYWRTMANRNATFA